MELREIFQVGFPLTILGSAEKPDGSKSLLQLKRYYNLEFQSRTEIKDYWLNALN
jgi:hypothetical protein